MEYERHPLSTHFGTVQGEEATALEASFGAGRSDSHIGAIVIYEDMILDGWHRYQGLPKDELYLYIQEFEGTYEEAVDYVVRANLARRHMNDQQRAHAIVSCTQWDTVPGPHSEAGETVYGDPRGRWMMRGDQSKIAGVSETSITRARAWWLEAHEITSPLCSKCHQRPPLEDQKMCAQCQEVKAAAPTPIEICEAKNETLREENAELRGKVEVARPVEGEATDEALRLGAAEAQEQAAEDRRTTVFWRKEAKDEKAKTAEAKANHEQAVKDLADASSEIQRLKTLLDFERGANRNLMADTGEPIVNATGTGEGLAFVPDYQPSEEPTAQPEPEAPPVEEPDVWENTDPINDDVQW